ncbi:hypothetical protein HGO21_22470 [Acinetobacter sp. CUI P1]|nr:hypothetical protein [Acinetobacter sp. CUI P1]
MSDEKFDQIFTNSKPVILAFHGMNGEIDLKHIVMNGVK